MMQEQQQQEEEQIKCPRCESTNTKFSYYNNYNLAQPRHYCKDCRRYWTLGGALREVPVGGGSRKSSSKRSSSSSSSSSSCRKNTKSKRSVPSSPEISLANDSSLFDERMMDITGSFTSLLASDGRFEELMMEGFGQPESSKLDNHLELRTSGNGEAGEKAAMKEEEEESLLGLHGWWMSSS